MTFAVVKPVPRRDFFSFCTTLRPIELKALIRMSPGMQALIYLTTILRVNTVDFLARSPLRVIRLQMRTCDNAAQLIGLSVVQKEKKSRRGHGLDYSQKSCRRASNL